MSRASSNRCQWRPIRLARLNALVNSHGWQWGRDPQTNRPCLIAPNGQTFCFRSYPLAIRRHQTELLKD